MNPQQMFRQKALEKLQSPDRLDELLRINSRSGWIALLAISALVVAALVWATVGTIRIATSGNGVLRQQNGMLHGTMYVSLTDAQRIQPGMRVLLNPVSLRETAQGMLTGQVAAVRPSPVTVADLTGDVGNDALAQAWLAQGAVIAVDVVLESDASSPDGYRWTLAQQHPITLYDRTPFVGQVTIREEAPIRFLLP